MFKEQSKKEVKSESGRIDSYYTYKTVNDSGLVTIEANVIVRDQSYADASVALAGVMKGIFSPAEEQLKEAEKE